MSKGTIRLPTEQELKLQARNLELILERDKLLAAIKNHNLNCQLTTPVDEELWKIGKEVEENISNVNGE